MIKRGIAAVNQVLFWSVISAAFIGPGTVTTALKSGALFQLNLLWVILFSAIACFVLQEASSRITIATGYALPEIIAKRFHNGRTVNVHYLLIGSIVFGCLAYQAGNIAGALAGIDLMLDFPRVWIIIFLYLAALALLWRGRIILITRILGILIVVMALVFILICLAAENSIEAIVQHLLVPHMPRNSGIYIIALIGTTIVPYNLFLGSGISRGRDLPGTRLGLTGSILIGGLITVFILLSGTMLRGEFSFDQVYHLFEQHAGKWAGTAFALGLVSAGITSSITAPLAAAITSRTLISRFSRSPRHEENLFRTVWFVVLTAGSLFSLLDYRPDMLIVAAQAINGLILPLVAFYLYVILNDRNLIPLKFMNEPWYNVICLVVVSIAMFLGFFHFFDTLLRVLNIKPAQTVLIVLTAIPVIWLGIRAARMGRKKVPFEVNMETKNQGTSGNTH